MSRKTRTVTTKGSKVNQEFAQWAITAIQVGRDPKYGPGLHSVYGGFNDAARKRFGWKTEKLIDEVDKLIKAGVLEVRGARGGPMLYVAGEKPEGSTKGDSLLAKMGNV